MHRSRCQMTIMGYIDDDSQRAELQEAMTFEISRIMGDYNKVIRTVNMMKTDDQEAVDRRTARLEKKAETQKALSSTGGDYIEGVKYTRNYTSQQWPV